MTSDPIRLFEDPSSAASLRGDLASATAVKIEGLDHAAGLAALESGIAAGSSAAGSSAGLSLLTKVGIGAVAVAGALALWLGTGDAETKPSPAASQVAEVTPEVRATATPPKPAPQVPAVVPSTPESEPPEPEVTPEPEATPEPEPEPAPATVVDSQPQELRRKGRTLRRTTPTGDAPFDDSVLREARMVAKARSSLASNPQRTFALTEQAEKDFPDGQLVEERRALAIEALAALGRTEEAERRADRFLAKYGRGAHAAAVRRALGR